MKRTWIQFVARRYLRAKKNTRFLSVSSSLSMGGIGLGVAAIIVVLSVMSGFEQELRTKLASSDLHVLMTPRSSFAGFDLGLIPSAKVNELTPIAELKSHPSVELYSAILGSELIIRAGNKVSGVMVKGVSDDRLERLRNKMVETALPQMLIERESKDSVRFPGVFIGRELAYEMGLIPGDFVTLISPILMDGPFSNIPRVKRFVVEGIYQLGVPDVEGHEVFTPIANMESFLRKRGHISQIEITLKKSEESAAFMAPYKKVLPDLRIRDWNELNGHLFASMKLERIAMFLILLFTVAIASLNIVSTLTLMVQEKIKEIAILKTLGSTRQDIRSIFLWNGIWVGGVGVVWGTLVALAILLMLKNTDFITLPDVYYDRHLPVKFDAWYFLGVPLTSFGIVLLAAYFPAQKAAQLTPLDGIRGY